MPTVKLTDRTAAAAKAGPGERVELWDETVPGLCLRVSNRGATAEGPLRKVWVWRYRTLEGRQPRLTLGDYSASFGLKWAREQVEELRILVRRGEDPAANKRRAKVVAQTEPLRTFHDLADAFLSASERGHWRPRRKQKRAVTINSERKVLDRHIRPILGPIRLDDIDKAMVRKLLHDMLDRKIGAQTNKTHAVIRQVLAYGVAQDRLAVNVAAAIPKPADVKPRTRVLRDGDLKALWGACDHFPDDLRLPPAKGLTTGPRLWVSRPMRIAIQLAVLLLVRRAEIAGMAVQELDLDNATWLIPGERMKSGHPHLVPLPPRAVALIKEALELAKFGRDVQPGHVFPSTHNEGRPFRPCSLTHAVANLCLALGLPHVSPHDIRRTGGSALTSERLGISPFIRSQVLAHRTDFGGGAAVSFLHYDVNDYVADKRRALAAWEALVLRIVGERAKPLMAPGGPSISSSFLSSPLAFGGLSFRVDEIRVRLGS